MDCSTPGFSVPHHLLKFAQVHVQRIHDAIQPSHPLLSPSPHALNLFQRQGLFRWIDCSLQVAKLLEVQLQHQSFQRVFRVDFRLTFRLTGLILQSKRLSGVFSSTINSLVLCLLLHFPWGSAGKETTGNAGDLGSIPGLGRSPAEGKGDPLQYSGLEISMNCVVHGAAKSWTWLSDFHFHCLLYCPALVSIHDYCKDQNLDYLDLVGKVMSLLHSTLSRFVIAFLPRSSCPLTSGLQSASAVILAQEEGAVTAANFSPSICHEVMGMDVMILVFLILSFKLAFSLSSFTLIKRLFSSSHFLPLES